MTLWVPGTVIDVSKWQDSLPSLTGVIGVIARAGIGTKPDAMFTTHIANARKAGKWVGSYWYNWGTLSVSDQVNAYINREREVGGVSLHAIDWEGADGYTAAQTADFIRIYRARTGEPIALYASEGRFRDLGQDWDWIANYSNEPSKHYDMWQYGPFRGVDGNHAKQTVIDLVEGGTVPTTTITVLPFGGKWTVPAGATVSGFKLDGPNGTIGTRKTLTTDSATGADYDATMTTDAVRGSPFIRVSSGYLDGFYVNAGGVTETPNPAPSSDCSVEQATIAEQAATIATLKTDLADANARLTATYANIDSLKA